MGGHAPPFDHWSATGPAIVCPPDAPEARCWVAYGDRRVTTNTLRELVFIPGPDGISGMTEVTQNFAFPAWDGRFTASHHDIAATFDPHPERLDIVFGFTPFGQWALGELQHGSAVWLDTADTRPPPGFSGSPPSPGFASGGLAFDDVQAGVAVTANPEASPPRVYMLANTRCGAR
jgi:hypothetical protein